MLNESDHPTSVLYYMLCSTVDYFCYILSFLTLISVWYCFRDIATHTGEKMLNFSYPTCI